MDILTIQQFQRTAEARIVSQRLHRSHGKRITAASGAEDQDNKPTDLSLAEYVVHP